MSASQRTMYVQAPQLQLAPRWARMRCLRRGIISSARQRASARPRVHAHMVPVIYSPQFLDHQVPPGHPECPERLVETVRLLRDESVVKFVEPKRVDQAGRFEAVLDAVLLVHHPDHVEEVREFSRTGRCVDDDTFITSNSFDVALLAVSAWMDGVDIVLETNAPAFVLARPPGHHATPYVSQGFCMFSNAAIAATYALKRHNLGKVSIFDFDVHHGNGTESVVRKESHMCFCSTHQSPLYPGTGSGDSHGPLNNILNLPLPAGTSWREYEGLLREKILPFFMNFDDARELLIVSAGYDALEDDPLGGMCMQPEDYARIVEMLMDGLGHSRILFGLEGGYSLNLERGIPSAIRHSVRALARAPSLMK